MCGLAGLWERRGTDAVQTMLNRLRHRGPDDEGWFERQSGTLGHRRRLRVLRSAGVERITSNYGLEFQELVTMDSTLMYRALVNND